MIIEFFRSLKKIKKFKDLILGKSKKNLRNQMMIKFYPVESGNLIKKNDKILIVAPHPDDEVISCGGIIAKYHNQVDVICINSSGIKYDWSPLSAEEVVKIRCDEFYKTMNLAQINKCWIAEISGVPPMFKQIVSNTENYLKNFKLSDYNIIFIPHKNDGHREHRFIANHFFKKLLKQSGYKKDLKIARYEIWAPIESPNYFEDITEVKHKKEQLINSYKSRKNGQYAEKILALNSYRGILSKFGTSENYSEAFYIQSVSSYLKEKDDKSWSKE